MDIRINNILKPNEIQGQEPVQEASGDFKFVLTSKLEDTNLQSDLIS